MWVSTLIHESGHFLVAIFLGYQVELCHISLLSGSTIIYNLTNVTHIGIIAIAGSVMVIICGIIFITWDWAPFKIIGCVFFARVCFDMIPYESSDIVIFCDTIGRGAGIGVLIIEMVICWYFLFVYKVS